MLSQAEIEDLKGRNPCDGLASRYVKLRKAGGKLMGACPICSPDPTSRDATRFEATADGWTCAVCCDGGDVIRLVQKINNCDFLAAVEILGGRREIDPAEAERAAKARAEIVAVREKTANEYRERERRRLWGMWNAAGPIAGSPVAAYLERRGVTLAISSARLRYLAECPMYADGAGKSDPVHRGPAMLAAIVGADDHFSGLHITWLDLDRAKGKAVVLDPATAEILPAKKVRGSKSGGRIELVAVEAPRRLMIGEGIETVASIAQAIGLDEQTAFWTSVDLGNLGGRAKGTVTHPSLKTAHGRAMRVPGPVPDLSAPAIPIPDTVDELVLLGDGDSDRFTTACKLACAAARYAREGRTIKIAWAPDGKDFNDLAIAGEAAAIAEIIASAKPAAWPAELAAAAAAAEKRAPAVSAARRARPSVTPSWRADRPPEIDKAELDLKLAFYPLTDLGNAERFRDRWRDQLFFCRTIGWHFWDGKRWARKGAEGRVKTASHATIRAIRDEADALAASDRDVPITVGKDKVEMLSERLRKWARESESNARLNALADQASGYVEVEPETLDRDKFKINCRNGTLDVDRGAGDEPYIQFYEHDPRDLITKIIPVDYDPAAECPLYDRFLLEVQPKADVRRFLHQWLGLSLTGDISDQSFCVWWGKGKNGKSVLQDTVAYIAGDYSETVPVETFISEGRGRASGQATPDLAILPGVRMLRTSEPKRNTPLDEALVKLVTGGEQLQVRHLNRDYFKFYPQFKMTISGNYRLKIAGTDLGIWRRMILVPWAVTISEEKRDWRLTEKLRAEAAGILNRLLEGLCDWHDHRLLIPDDAAAARADYQVESDPLGRFLEDCTEAAIGERVSFARLYELFTAWTKGNAAAEWTAKGLSMALSERGIRSKRSNGVYVLDMRLTKMPRDFVDAHGRPIDPETGAAIGAVAGEAARQAAGAKPTDDDVTL